MEYLNRRYSFVKEAVRTIGLRIKNSPYMGVVSTTLRIDKMAVTLVCVSAQIE